MKKITARKTWIFLSEAELTVHSDFNPVRWRDSVNIVLFWPSSIFAHILGPLVTIYLLKCFGYGWVGCDRLSSWVLTTQLKRLLAAFGDSFQWTFAFYVASILQFSPSSCFLRRSREKATKNWLRKKLHQSYPVTFWIITNTCSPIHT